MFLSGGCVFDREKLKGPKPKEKKDENLRNPLEKVQIVIF